MNVFENIPYDDEQMGRRKLVDQKHLLIMQIALKPGQVVPEHNANSNVHLLVLKGTVDVTLNMTTTTLKEGDLFAIAYQTPMSIRNVSDQNATFLVIK
ncbi:MAG: cupin domain-containing protein, partial [Pseudothermotoga sp.]